MGLIIDHCKTPVQFLFTGVEKKQMHAGEGEWDPGVFRLADVYRRRLFSHLALSAAPCLTSALFSSPEEFLCFVSFGGLIPSLRKDHRSQCLLLPRITGF